MAEEVNPLKPELKACLDLKTQYPEGLLLTKTADGQFYEAFMADARVLAETTEVILTSTDSGSPDLGRVPGACDGLSGPCQGALFRMAAAEHLGGDSRWR
ncbi:hypothetical protein IQ265_24215 [Nodosilinea sp. LEGE 06152]|nr:hypothetical protein [Nodosilinea sp. LEGE 06152]